MAASKPERSSCRARTSSAGVCAEVDEEGKGDEKPFETHHVVPSSPIPERGVRERGPRQEEKPRTGMIQLSKARLSTLPKIHSRNRTSRGEISARSASTQPIVVPSQGRAVPHHLFQVMPCAPDLARATTPTACSPDHGLLVGCVASHPQRVMSLAPPALAMHAHPIDCTRGRINVNLHALPRARPRNRVSPVDEASRLASTVRCAETGRPPAIAFTL